MCQRQIDRRSTPPKPCNDNQPRTITRLTPSRPIAYRTGILAAVLERTERVRLDVLAAGVVTIQGQRQGRKKESTRLSGRSKGPAVGATRPVRIL
jgi:hypothetical protein